MARLGRKPVPPGRAAIAVSLGTIGLFVVSMAVGLGSDGGGWPFGAVGAALIIIAVALLTTASMRGGDKEFVNATVEVVKVSDPPTFQTEYGRCEMHVLVDSPNHPGQTVTVRDPRVPVAKWPEVGDRLPALIGVSDIRHIKIQWDQVGGYTEPYDPSYGDDSYADERYADRTYNDQTYVDDDLSDIQDPEELYLDDNDGYSTRVEPVVPDTLPRRQPSVGQRHSVAVLEGELIPAEVPAPRTAGDDDDHRVDVIDFSDVPEPVEPTPVHSGPAFVDEPVMPTQPQARPAAAGSIHGVGITVLVSDLERSLRFYHDMLGFYEIDSGPESAVLASGDTRVVLMAARDQAPVHKRLVHLNLEVGDVEAVYQELRVRGVRFTYPPRVVNRGERLELVAAAFKDPDGHGIAVTQWKAINI